MKKVTPYRDSENKAPPRVKYEWYAVDDDSLFQFLFSGAVSESIILWCLVVAAMWVGGAPLTEYYYPVRYAVVNGMLAAVWLACYLRRRPVQ